MMNTRKIGDSYSFYIASSALSFLILFSRRPDVITNPQFWAEDGRVWYADAYNHGLMYSLLTPEAGYFQTISRIVAVFAQVFPLAYAPLVFNLAAIFVKLIVVNFLLSSRFSRLIPDLRYRILIACIYLALPHSFETHANLTNVQWHLGLLSLLIIIAAPPAQTLWKIFDITAVAISSLSGPFCIFLLPIAAVMYLFRRERSRLVLLIILAAGSLIQISSLLLTERPSQQPLGATFGLLMKIIGGHLFISAILGERGHSQLIKLSWWNDGTAILINLVGFAVLIYGFIKSNLELRLLIVFSFMIFCGALLFPAITSEAPQWTFMWLPATGSRYWLIPIFCFLITLLYLARNADFRLVRFASVGLLGMSLLGVAGDWKYPRYANLNFQSYAAEFEKAPIGQEVVIPINPNWEMRLLKK